MSSSRRPIYVNPAPRTTSSAAVSGALAFHEQFPGYAASPLLALPAVADELGVRAVYVKQESNRFGLPSFKILGASWAIYQALRSSLGLPDRTSFDTLIERVRAEPVPVTLIAATEGNHGRAVARVAQNLSLPCRIYVPRNMHVATQEKIRSEGADVMVVDGDYDCAVQTAATVSQELPCGMLVQDTAFNGYEDIPAWVVEGYATLLREADAQLNSLDLQASLVVAPVGVGSFAQATPATVVAVEPETAPGLTHSLEQGRFTSVITSASIMAGMNCGTVSSAAWPVLQRLVDVSVTVSDWESHCAVQDLAAFSIDAGPCGAASLAAIRRLKGDDSTSSTLRLPESVVLLLSTEGSREYDVPKDDSIEDAVALA